MTRGQWQQGDERVRRNALEEQGSAEPQIGARPLSDWTFLAIAAGIVLVALLLRIYRIGEQELWIDESFSFSMAAMPNRVARALFDTNPPLYYVLLRGWTAFAGHSEAALRLLSACFGTLFVAGVIWAGREIFTPRAGLWSGGFAAVAPIHIYYSQEARAYTLLTLAFLLTYIMLWRALKRNTWSSWALVSACILLALYSHYFAILGLLPTAFLVLFWPERRGAAERWLRYAAAWLLSGLLFLPWPLWSFVLRPHSFESIAWIQKEWERMDSRFLVPRSLEVLGLGGQKNLFGQKQFAHLEFPSSLLVLGVVFLLLLGIWAVLPWGDGRLGIPWLGRRKVWLGMLLFFPLVALWLVSFYKPLYMVGRYDMVAFPAYALLLGLALAKVQRIRKVGPLLAAVVALGLLIPIGAKLALYYKAPSRSSYRAAARVLHASVDNGDVVVLTNWHGISVIYYLHQLGYRCQDRQCENTAVGRSFSCRFFPRYIDQFYFAGPAHSASRYVDAGEEAIREDVEEYLTPLRTRAGGLWVVLGSVRYYEGRRLVPNDVARLIVEFRNRGLTYVPETGDPRIFQFRRS
jgi:4-amino-4-deoxy-L-arabinose transferase-like glycosyltransferase